MTVDLCGQEMNVELSTHALGNSCLQEGTNRLRSVDWFWIISRAEILGFELLIIVVCSLLFAFLLYIATGFFVEEFITYYVL